MRFLLAACLALGAAPAALAAPKPKRMPAAPPAASKPKVPPPAAEDDAEAPADDDEAEPAAAAPAAPAPEAATPRPEPAPTGYPSDRAYAWLDKVIGPQALKLLAERGYLLTYRLDDTPYLAHLRWEALETLVRHAPSLLEAQAVIGGFRNGRSPEGKEEALRALVALPSTDLVTPRIRSAASLLLDLLAERAAAGSLPLPQRPFASLPWARDFVRRYRVPEVRDSSSLVDPYFLELLTAPGPSASAQADLQEQVQGRYDSDIAAIVARDARAGQLSDELRGWISKYLEDNRRALRLVRLPAEFAALFADNRLQRELADLRLAADALSQDPAFLDVLRAALAGQSPAVPALTGAIGAAGLAPGPDSTAPTRVTLGELHLHSPLQGDAFEPGSRATLSAAYWLDGMKRGASVRAQEFVFADFGARGARVLASTQRTLGPGGPYTLSVEAPVEDGTPFDVRLILHVAGAKPALRAESVTPSKALERALESLGRADAQLEACKLREASASYDALAREAIERSQGAEPTAAGLAAAELKPRQRRVEAALEDFERLDGLLEVVRQDASTRDCTFSTERAELGRSLLRRLPAGCSRDLAPELNVLLAAASKRSRDQETFRAAVAGARKLQQGCKFSEAARRFAAALAVLDADAAARCGEAAAEYETVQGRDLPAALAGDAIRSEFSGQVDAAAKALEEGEPAKALAVVNPLLARLGAHAAASCYGAEGKRAEELAARAGAALSPAKGALARVKDSVDATTAAVARERDRRQAELDALLRREQAQQAPAALEPLPGLPAAAPPVESGDVPAAKPAREETDRASKAAEAEAAADGAPVMDEADAASLAGEKAARPAPNKKPAAKPKAPKRSKP